jgi:hypothetical protein
MTNPTLPLRIVDQITTATDKRFELVACMADFIVEMTLGCEGCTQRDLLACGFTQQDVVALWHFASALAAVEIKCRKNGIVSSFGMKNRCITKM